MEMGNSLYSALSQCTGQVYSVQTELSSIITMSEKNYELNHSKSYTSNLSESNSIIQGYQYSIPVDRAFESVTLVTKVFISPNNRMHWCQYLSY